MANSEPHDITATHDTLSSWAEDCEIQSKAYEEAARVFARRNWQLAILAILFSVLAGAPALATVASNTGASNVGSSSEESTQASLSTPTAAATITQSKVRVPSVVQWGIAVVAIAAAVVNGIQQSPIASPDKAQKYHTTANGYNEVKRAIELALAVRLPYEREDEQQKELLSEVNTLISNVKDNALILPRKVRAEND
jgi:hypothetical protein